MYQKFRSSKTISIAVKEALYIILQTHNITTAHPKLSVINRFANDKAGFF